jgi:hypothetical protein
MKSINFELVGSMTYTGSNGEAEANHIELIEPSGKVAHHACAIRAMYKEAANKAMSALSDDVKEAIQQALEADDSKNPGAENADDSAATKEPMIGGDEFMEMLYAGGAPMEKFVITFRELFKSVAKIGGEKLMTSTLLDRMTYKDIERMMGVYSANFIVN